MTLPTQGADYVADEQPLLGMAKTHQLLQELAVRFEIPTPDEPARRAVIHLLLTLPEGILDYRTVDA